MIEKYHKLSIIIPCYNCKDTLEESLVSVYKQDLEIPYEIIMVDDGSSDGTVDLMIKLSKKYLNINCYFHDKNKGGGATRNTCVEKSSGDLIFCLDSDDILPPSVLPVLIRLLVEKDCDGVLFSETKFFKNKVGDLKNSSVKNLVSYDNQVQLIDLFKTNIGFLTMINFLYTKKSFLTTGGYPINHSFDTQGFGLKYLAQKNRVFVCPSSFYHHRRAYKKVSYFEREYEKGEMSLNWYLIMEEIFHLLSPVIRREILNYDIFQRAALNDNLKNYIDSLFLDTNNIFLKNYETFTCRNGMTLYCEEISGSIEDTDIFVKSIKYFKEQEFDKSLDCLNILVKSGLNSKIIYFNILRNYFAISKKVDFNNIEKEVVLFTKSLSLKKQDRIFVRDYLEKIKFRMKNIIKNYV